MNGPLMTIQEAVARHQAGDWDGAAAAYEHILAHDPQHVDALHLSGVIAHQRGEYSEAIRLIESALSLRPQNAVFHNNLGNALQAVGRYDEAEQHFRSALAADPNYVDARFNLGALFQEQKDFDSAAAEFAAVLRMQPRMAPAYHRLGMLAYRQGQVSDAVRFLDEALSCDPNLDQAALLLAKAQRAAGQDHKALEQLRGLCAKYPQQIEARFELASTLLGLGKDDEAIGELCSVIDRAPEHARAHHHLGVAYMRRLQFADAEACFLKALRIRPDFAAAHNSLGCLLRDQGQLAAAVKRFREAIRLSPQSAEARANLAGVLQLQGRPGEAIAAYREALKFDGGSERIHSNLLMTLHYDPDLTPEEIFAEHQQWARRHAVPTSATRRRNGNPDPARALRIAYLSADFRTHSVAFFIEPLLAAHDQQVVHVTCYSDVTAPDEMTARLKSRADRWRDVAGVADADLARMIAADEIDILIDLAGHTGGNRLKLLAQRAAPIQVTHLGYGGTTGLSAVDYRLSDVIVDPPGESQRHTEELAYLPSGIFCYAPPIAPDVPPLPCLENGYVTFGSFNNLAKIHRGVVELWAGLLKSLPTSRLLMKNNSFNDAATRDDFRRAFAELGISADRLELLGQTPTLPEHLELYRRVDIALDSFPYTGATTTCEALWMGVPVVTQRGNTYVGRLSASVLTHVGCTELIADTPQEYTAIARQLAENKPKLAEARAALRACMADSPVCDAQAAARGMEALFRDMWQRLCREYRKAG